MNKILTLCICLFLTACDDAKSAWTDVIKKCADNQLNGNTILYFGPSNGVGPGSVWRPGSNGGYRLRYNLNDMPDPKSFFEAGKEVACDGKKTTTFGTKASIGLTTSLTPASAELATDFKKAKNIEVKVGSIAWDLVKEGPYENYINSLPNSNSIREDLNNGSRLVLYRALKVNDFKAILKFSESVAAELKAKYSGKIGKEISGDIGADLSATWTSDTTLTLQSPGSFYIAGELVPYNVGGFASSNHQRFGEPIAIPAESKVDTEKVD